MELYEYQLESYAGSGENCIIRVEIESIEYQPDHDTIARDIRAALSARTDFQHARKSVTDTTTFTA